MADTYKVGPKPPKAKNKEEQAERLDPDKGDRVTKSANAYIKEAQINRKASNRVLSSRSSSNTMVQGKNAMKAALIKAGASNLPHNARKR